MNGKSAPSYDFFNKFVHSEFSVKYNVEWLISGKGEMFKNNREYDHSSSDSSVVADTTAGVFNGRKMTPSGKTVPLYDMNTGVGLKTLFEKGHQHIIDFVTIPHMIKIDGAISITGDNMYPILKSGDIIIFKKVNNPEYLVPGEIYVLAYELGGDEHCVVTYVNKAKKKGFVELVSYNRHHQSIDIPLRSIRAIALVKANLRYNSME